jgi:histidinol-phosphatase (PHP family)
MMFDCHIHSMVSPDSQMRPKDVITALKKKGMGTYFTEHVDFYPPGGKLPPDHPYYQKNYNADFTRYLAEYMPLRSETVRLGLEIGLTAETGALNRAQAESADYDFIIGSVHWTERYDLSAAGEFYAEHGTDVYRRHLIYVRRMIEENDFFHALGHIDYISRYTPLAQRYAWYEDYPDEYDTLCKALIEREKVLELNTRQFHNPDIVKLLRGIFTRYRALGGRYATIGSDAHELDKLGYQFETALSLLRELDIKPVRFVKRKRVEIT